MIEKRRTFLMSSQVNAPQAQITFQTMQLSSRRIMSAYWMRGSDGLACAVCHFGRGRWRMWLGVSWGPRSPRGHRRCRRRTSPWSEWQRGPLLGLVPAMGRPSLMKMTAIFQMNLPPRSPPPDGPLNHLQSVHKGSASSKRMAIVIQ